MLLICDVAACHALPTAVPAPLRRERRHEMRARKRVAYAESGAPYIRVYGMVRSVVCHGVYAMPYAAAMLRRYACASVYATCRVADMPP